MPEVGFKHMIPATKQPRPMPETAVTVSSQLIYNDKLKKDPFTGLTQKQ
jgi:hypothetical protein